MDLAKYTDLKLTREGRILRIELHRPEALNAVTKVMHHELSRVFLEAADDPDSDLIVLTGAGKVFCAGGDYNWMRAGVLPFYPRSRDVRNMVYGIIDCPKPIIARVNGDAYGLGASLALLCDLIIATDTARFADPHVRAGLGAGDGGVLIWPHLLGFAKAKEHLILGSHLSALEALRLGMINRAVPAAQLDEVVADYSRRLLAGAQVAIRYTKSVTNIALRQTFNSAFEASLAYEGLTLHTRDHQAAVKAFLEGQRPDFVGE
jgi:enoyl-CoA hydratase